MTFVSIGSSRFPGLLILLFILVTLPMAVSQDASDSKPRLFVLTDIGGDPDDEQSLRRLMVYGNEFRIEGIVATATWGRPPHRKRGVYHINEDMIYEIIDEYAQDYPHLTLHDAAFPAPDALRAVVRGGQKDRGVANLIPGKSTPGSQLIMDRVDASDEPLWVTVWGGAHDLAQALLDVRESRPESETDRFVQKLRVYAIGDQDLKFTPEGTGAWIRENFPGIFYIEAGPQWVRSDFGSSAGYRGMYQNDSKGGLHPEVPLVRPGEEWNDTAWIRENVQPFGALGAGYPSSVNLNPNSPRNTRGVKEGDTPALFYVLPHGINDPEHPEWGGWGGRFQHIFGNYYADAQDDHWTGSTDGGVKRKWTVARWREGYQHDFTARMRWCASDYEEANHHPIAVIDHDRTNDILFRDIKPGQSIILNARRSRDPDGDNLQYNWWIYHEASSSTGILQNSDKAKAKLKTSSSSPDGEIHIILEVSDDGHPRLTSYRRVVINVGRR